MSVAAIAASRPVGRTQYRHGMASRGERTIAEETAIAFTYNRVAHAVMMATPADLEDFAVGFSMAEGIIAAPGDIAKLETVEVERGVELRMDISSALAAQLDARRRHVAGPSGCGLCGLESLEQAMRTPPRVDAALNVTPAMIESAIAALPALQRINQLTRAVHAAAFWQPAAGLVALREDVGRHNALDKLAGALARAGIAAAQGMVLLTSRVSIELVQKVALMGAPIIVAVSAPTALAVRVADSAGITLIGVAREDGFEIFTHAGRIAVQGK
jgi:FdhD protein